ncbi:hypothetical protein [Candidatus Electronema sp. PJ]|uniref:hypothetical protein n=1 Tax=Candidatus Electronema sp. PJ TaxID=3401572 RepID=UPI003AA80D1C
MLIPVESACSYPAYQPADTLGVSLLIPAAAACSARKEHVEPKDTVVWRSLRGQQRQDYPKTAHPARVKVDRRAIF